jgi:hypothetical protein
MIGASEVMSPVLGEKKTARPIVQLNDFDDSRLRRNSMAAHPAAKHHAKAAEHHRLAEKYHALAAKHYKSADNAQAAQYALVAQGHSYQANHYMSEAAKTHAEQHRGNKHARS